MTDYEGRGHCSSDSMNHFKIASSRLKKRCLFLLILGLMVMIIVNMALILWMMKVMDFSTTSMGGLRLVPGGLQLIGNTLMMGSLSASTIKARHGRPLTIESATNFTINSRDSRGVTRGRLFLGNNRLECWTSSFVISDRSGVPMFSANSREVVVGSRLLRVTGEGGTVFSGSVQTPLVRSESGHELRLESTTRSVKVNSPKGVHLESRASDIKTICLNDLTIKSIAGKIKLEASSIMISGLKIASPALPQARPHGTDTERPPQHIYQLCACANGKLFMAQPHGLCVIDDANLTCR